MSTRVDDRRSSEAWARTEPLDGPVPIATVAREIQSRRGVAPGFFRRSQQVGIVAAASVLSLAPGVALVAALLDPAAGRAGVRIAFGIGLVVLAATLLVWLVARRRRAPWMVAVVGTLAALSAATVVVLDMVLAGSTSGAGASWLLLVASVAALGALLAASVPDGGHAAKHARSVVIARLAQRGLVDERIATAAIDEPVDAWDRLR